MEKTVKGSVMILYMMSCCDDSTLSAVPVWAGTMLSAIVFLKNAHYVVDAWYLDVVDKNVEQSCWWC